MCYYKKVALAFSEARQACEMDGGALLSIESPSEQRDVEHLLQVRHTSRGGISDGDFWIGLTRVGGADNTLTPCPDLYQWTDGSVATFRNWYFDEPSCGGEACVVMYHQPTAPSGLGGAYLYQWNDDRCNMKHNFICKYEPGEPSYNTLTGQVSEVNHTLTGQSRSTTQDQIISLIMIHNQISFSFLGRLINP
uniref:Chondrolectin n=1 Tax=Fundulus heteroclitus TaxID=8078 RepID=A0A3Q2Q929_FUNHE